MLWIHFLTSIRIKILFFAICCWINSEIRAGNFCIEWISIIPTAWSRYPQWYLEDFKSVWSLNFGFSVLSLVERKILLFLIGCSFSYLTGYRLKIKLLCRLKTDLDKALTFRRILLSPINWKTVEFLKQKAMVLICSLV